MMSPSINKKLVDVACGTGDIGKLFLDKTNKKSKVTSIDPNKKMISQGRNKLSKYRSKEAFEELDEKIEEQRDDELSFEETYKPVDPVTVTDI